MKQFILGFVVAAGTSSFAAGQYKLFYANSSGKQMNAQEALLAAAKGETVFKCQTTELGVSKSGTSISLKATKKPKQ
jgi:fructoselysine-6-P-deglycase FrlB-like protein